MARHAGDFIFDDSQVWIVSSHLDADPNKKNQRKHMCPDDAGGGWIVAWNHK
jgi:hypothetical protein